MLSLEEYIAEKRLDNSLAERLRALTAADRPTILELLEELDPSANTLRELFRLADEVARRDRSTISAVILGVREELSATLANAKLGRKDRQRLFREALERRRYPVREQIRQELLACEERLLRELNLRCRAPQDFEGDTLEISATVRSAADLQQLAERLQQASDHPSFKRILDILKGESELVV